MHDSAGVLHVGAHIDVADVHIDPGGRTRIFALNDRRPIDNAEIGYIAQRDLRPRRGRNQHPPERRQIIAQLAAVTDVDRIPLKPLDGLCNIHPADGRHDHILHVAHRQAVPGGFFAVYAIVDKVAADGLVREGAQCARRRLQDGRNALPQIGKHVQVGAHQFDAHRRLDARREHIDARFDGHGPGVGETRKVDSGIEFPDEFVHGHAFSPLAFRLQGDRGFYHGQWRRVRRRFGPPHLAESMIHLGEALDDLVRLLQELPGLGNADARIGGGHVEQVPLVQGRHKFGAELAEGPGRGSEDDQRCRNGYPFEPEYGVNHRAIDANQKPIDGILFLRQDIAAYEVAHQHRHHRNGQ